MKDEINKIISWIEMSYTKLNYKEELLLVNYIKQLQQENKKYKEENEFLKRENKQLKDKLIEINEVINGYMPNQYAMCKAFDEIEFILSKEVE